MQKGQKQRAQHMMRGRVLAQGATIIAIGLYYGWFTSNQPKLGDESLTQLPHTSVPKE